MRTSVARISRPRPALRLFPAPCGAVKTDGLHVQACAGAAAFPSLSIRTALPDPALDCRTREHETGLQHDFWLGKGRIRAQDLIDALARDAEHLRDLADADKMMSHRTPV